MNRRNVLKSIAAAGFAGPRHASRKRAQQAVEKAVRGTPAPKIKDIQVIETAPGGVRLTVVKILTDQDGLYGYGCATFTQRADLVKPAVERYLKPLLLNHPVDRIEDTWQLCYDSSYWKNGPVLNNAISGIDQALWDIKGRQAEYAGLRTGRRQVPRSCRLLTRTLPAAKSSNASIRRSMFMEQGFRNVRVQVSTPGL